VYIIISSARNELSDKILGYGLGADDYLAKPYEPRELVLKINSALRRTLKSKKKIGDFEIDEEKMQIVLEGYVLDLTKIEFDLLHLLLSNPEKFFRAKRFLMPLTASDIVLKTERSICM